MAAESEIWSGPSSQILNLGTYIVCGLISLTVVGAIGAIPYAVWKYLVVKNLRYEVTSQRIKVYSGVLNRKIEELELYRVKDTKFEQPFFFRLFGLANLIIVSTDTTTPISMIPAIKNAQELREQLRVVVEARRDEKRVRLAELE